MFPSKLCSFFFTIVPKTFDSSAVVSLLFQRLLLLAMKAHTELACLPKHCSLVCLIPCIPPALCSCSVLSILDDPLRPIESSFEACSLFFFNLVVQDHFLVCIFPQDVHFLLAELSPTFVFLLVFIVFGRSVLVFQLFSGPFVFTAKVFPWRHCVSLLPGSSSNKLLSRFWTSKHRAASDTLDHAIFPFRPNAVFRPPTPRENILHWSASLLHQRLLIKCLGRCAFLYFTFYNI